MPHTVLIAGATGRLGEPVARRLLADGYAVRILARNTTQARQQLGEGFAYVAGDVTQAESLPAALVGVDSVYISLRGTNTIASYEQNELLGTQNLAKAAAQAGVQRIVYLSGAGDLAAHADFPVARIKLGAERALIESGVPYTILRATHFMEFLPMFVRGKRATVIGHQPHAYHYLAVDDYAEMVSQAIKNSAAANTTLTVYGPKAYTMQAALEVYKQICAPNIKVDSLPLPLFKFIAWLTRNPDMRWAAILFSGFQRIAELGAAQSKEANELLGEAGTTLEQWCENYKMHLKP
ncbi:MAG: NAD(P)H-binding protein [Gammaproteobacteria bacterium]|nr:NAD(P)H-binding protein [Gammaproteobacteria bacterium]